MGYVTFIKSQQAAEGNAPPDLGKAKVAFPDPAPTVPRPRLKTISRMSYLSLNEILSAHDKSVGWRAGLLLGLLGGMWLTFAITQLLPDGVLAVWGIVPRTSAGIGGILAAPFPHSDLDHIAANTLSLLTLGSLILLRWLREFVWVTQIGVLVAGFGTWTLGAPNTHHIGASGTEQGTDKGP